MYDSYLTEQFNLDGKSREYSIFIDGELAKKITCDSIIKEYVTEYNTFTDYEKEFENAYFFENGNLVSALELCYEIDIKITYQYGRCEVYVKSLGE